jgi:hypothetical protein
VSKYALPTVEAGQCMLCVNLSELKAHSVAQALIILEEIGFQPELRYDQNFVGTELYALLRYDQLDPTKPISDEHLGWDFDKLCKAFPGETFALRCLQGSPVSLPVAV